MLETNLNPNYYSTTIVTEDKNFEDQLVKAGIGSGISTLLGVLGFEINKLSPSFTRLGLRFFVKIPGIDNLVARKIEIEFDPSTKGYTVTEFIGDVAGTAAVAAAVASVLGVGTTILGAAVLTRGIPSLIWSGIKEIDAVENVIDLITRPVQTDIQIVRDNNIIGGALFKEGLSREDELEAVKKLLARSIINDFANPSKNIPNISFGQDFIRVVKTNTLIDREDKIYRVYDGKLVDAISETLNISREELLSLGTEDDPNTNEQIHYYFQSNTPSFVFTSEENRFFVPLPQVNGGVNVQEFHPGNILFGTENNDVLDAFENSGRDPDFLREDVLMLGLEGDDTIKGNLEKDIIFGGQGNDDIDGSGGEDTAVFSDDFANYDYSISENGTITFTHVKGTKTDGADTLTNVEFAQFKDQIVSLPLDEPESDPESSEKSITLKFKTTLNSSFPSTQIGFPPEIIGTNPQLELTYTVNSEDAIPNNPLLAQKYESITGTLSINGQTISLIDGTLILGNSISGTNDRYEIGFRGSEGTLFGREISSLGLSFFTLDETFVTEQNVFKDTDFTVVEFYDLGIGFREIRFPNSAEIREKATSISVDEFRFRESPRTPFTVTIDNRATNSSPVAVNDFAITQVNTSVTLSIIDLLLNDKDSDGDTLTFKSVNYSDDGTVELDSDNIIFTPDAGFVGDAAFDYTIADSLGNTDTATVTVKVIPIENAPPVANNNTITTEVDTAIAISTAELLLNDSDSNGDDLTIDSVGNSVNGTVELNSDSIIFNPDSGFTGIANFNYTVSDGKGGTDSATVDVTVTSTETEEKEIPDEIDVKTTGIEDTGIQGVVGIKTADTKLIFTVSTVNPDADVNELVVFEFDDGTPDLKQLLENGKAKVISSTIPNEPNGFNTNTTFRTLEFSSGAKLGFALIKNGSADDIKAGTPKEIVLSTSNDFIFSINETGLELNIEGFSIQAKTTDKTTAIATGLQTGNEGELLDLRDITGEVDATFSIFREAAFDNEVVFYKVDNSDGFIGSLDPDIATNSDYLNAVLGNLVKDTNGNAIRLEVNNQSTNSITAKVEAGSIFAPMIIINGNLELLQDTDISNDPTVYFPYIGANSDGVDHIRLLGDNTFGFEDLPGGGDLDYNDIIVKVDFSF